MGDLGANTVYLQIGRRIRSAREARGATQDVLASRADLTRASVSNIEAGRQRVTVHALLNMAAALEVDPASLLPDHEATPRSDVDELIDRGVQPEEAEKIARLLRS